MGEVETPHGILARVSGGSASGGESERIGNRQTVLTGNKAAGSQVPPGVGIGELGGEQADEEHGAKRQ